MDRTSEDLVATADLYVWRDNEAAMSRSDSTVVLMCFRARPGDLGNERMTMKSRESQNHRISWAALPARQRRVHANIDFVIAMSFRPARPS